MKILGLRCSNTDYTYVLLRGDKSSSKVIAAESINYPLNSNWPETLLWLSLEIEQRINTYAPDGMLIKKAELRGRMGSGDFDRIESEGVIALTAKQRGVKFIISKRKRTIAKDIGYKGTAEGYNTAMKDGAVDSSCIKNCTDKINEAIMVARSGLR